MVDPETLNTKYLFERKMVVVVIVIIVVIFIISPVVALNVRMINM
jgi:hypothetical protein